MNTTTEHAFVPHQLVTAREAATILSICEKTLYTLTRRGEITATRIGKAVRYSQAELARFVSKSSQPITYEQGDLSNG